MNILVPLKMQLKHHAEFSQVTVSNTGLLLKKNLQSSELNLKSLRLNFESAQRYKQ
jgi:hypothetical protein